MKTAGGMHEPAAETERKNQTMLSVIIPVYNVSGYLEECLESVRNQTLSDLEIILVDDGSTDGSGLICDRAAEKDSRIKVIHQENKGLSGARNTGLQNIHGEWVAFADSDDVLDPSMYETMLSRANAFSADLVVCGLHVFSDEKELKKHERTYRVSEKDRICNEKEYWSDYDMTRDVVWNKLYRRPLLEGICFPEGKYCEDVFVMHRIISRCGRICMIPECFYRYRLRSGSIMQSKHAVIYLDSAEGLLQRSDFFEKRDMYVLQRNMLRAAMYNLSKGCTRMERQDKEDRLRYAGLSFQCRKHCLGAMRHGTDIRFLCSLLPFLAGPRLHRAAFLLREMLKKSAGQE